MSLIFFFSLCLFLSALFSGTEMAFVSANRVKLRELADDGNKSAQKLMHLYSKADHFLTTLLIGNNIVNVAATAILTYAFEIHFGMGNEWLVTIVMAPILIIFGEMVPKDYCRIRGHHFLLRSSWFFVFFSRILQGPVNVVLGSIHFFLGTSRTKVRKGIFVSEKEFRSLIEESARDGLLEPHEKQMINTILDFERIQVVSVMTPMEKAAKVSITATVQEVKEIARRTHSKMVLVYEEIPSIVVGMVYVFDLLFEEDETQGLKKFLRAPLFVPKHTSVEKAFFMLQEKRQSYAVVTGERGDVVGVVPIEQLMAVS